MPPRSGWGKRPAPQSGGRRSLGSAPLPQAAWSRRHRRWQAPRLRHATYRHVGQQKRSADSRGSSVYAGFSPDLAHSIPLATPSDCCEVPYGLQDTGGEPSSGFAHASSALALASSLKALFVRSPTTIPGLSARSGFSPWLTGARAGRRRRNWSARSGRATANRS